MYSLDIEMAQKLPIAVSSDITSAKCQSLLYAVAVFCNAD